MRQTLISFAVVGALAMTFVPTSASAQTLPGTATINKATINRYHGRYYNHRGYYHHHYRYW